MACLVLSMPEDLRPFLNTTTVRTGFLWISRGVVSHLTTYIAVLVSLLLFFTVASNGPLGQAIFFFFLFPLYDVLINCLQQIYTTASLESNPQRHRYFVPGFLVSAIRRVIQGDTKIRRLFDLPIDGPPPKKIRASLWEYFFPSISEHLSTGAWYTRKQITGKVEIQ